MTTTLHKTKTKPKGKTMETMKFCPEMVAAIADGRKSETRRKIKGITSKYTLHGYDIELSGDYGVKVIFWNPEKCKRKTFKPPYYKNCILAVNGDPTNTIRLESIAFQRLGEMEEADYIREGIEPKGFGWKDYTNPDNEFRDPRDSFVSLWESIYGTGSWDPEAWVWVHKFHPVKEVLKECKKRNRKAKP